MTQWAETTSLAIQAIRDVDTNHAVLVSGTQFARLSDWEVYSMPALSAVYQTLGGFEKGLIYDFHQYFDDLGGAYSICEPWTTYLQKFASVTNILRGAGAKGIMTEFGGGPNPQCSDLFEKLLGFFDDNSDVWLGWTAWGSPGGLELSVNSRSPFNTLTKVLQAHAPLKSHEVQVDTS
jgi:endoglucanase